MLFYAPPRVTDWSNIASVSTAAGTLVLAVATFSSVRASQRAARVAEEALLIGRRPVLGPAREDDPPMTVNFGDRHVVTVPGGGASVERVDDRFYFVLPLRNVGQGIAVLHGWRHVPEAIRSDAPELDAFRRQSRDLYIPAGQIGFWQAAIRDPEDDMRGGVQAAFEQGQSLVFDLLYGDHEGGQRAVSRFSIFGTDDGGWIPGVIRHFRLDGVNPRD